MDTKPNGRNERRRTLNVQVEGRKLAVDVWESAGPAVLLLHGIPGGRSTWSGVAPLLPARLRLLVPDLPGFGDSDSPDGDVHAAEHARVVLALLDALRVDRAHLVGFDFGGPVALTLYRMAPERVESLCLVNTNVFTDTPVPAPLQVAGVPLLGPVAFRLIGSRPSLALLWFWAAAERGGGRWPEYLRGLRGSAVAWTRRILFASLRDLPGLYGAIQATLATVRVPATVVWGERDAFFPAGQGRRTAAAIPGARMVPLPCGHFVPLERPRELAEAIAAVVAAAEDRRALRSPA